VLLGVAGGCKTRISKPFSLLCLAQCCRVLRSRGCQSVMTREQARRAEAGLSGPARSCPRLPLCRIALRPVSSALQISHRARSLSPSLPLRVSHSLYSYMPFRFFPDENRANSCKSVTYFSTRARRRSSTSMVVVGIKTDFEPKRPPILTLTYSGSQFSFTKTLSALPIFWPRGRRLRTPPAPPGSRSERHDLCGFRCAGTVILSSSAERLIAAPRQ
jgi:hypothetical protein